MVVLLHALDFFTYCWSPQDQQVEDVVFSVTYLFSLEFHSKLIIFCPCHAFLLTDISDHLQEHTPGLSWY